MELRICPKCGRIWDYDTKYPYLSCEKCETMSEHLGQVVLELRRKERIHHGKLK